jgi:hypothetical protein
MMSLGDRLRQVFQQALARASDEICDAANSYFFESSLGQGSTVEV